MAGGKHYALFAAALVVAGCLAFAEGVETDWVETARSFVGAATALGALLIVGADLARRPGPAAGRPPEATAADVATVALAVVVGGLAARDISLSIENLPGDGTKVWYFVLIMVGLAFTAWVLRRGHAQKRNGNNFGAWAVLVWVGAFAVVLTIACALISHDRKADRETSPESSSLIERP